MFAHLRSFKEGKEAEGITNKQRYKKTNTQPPTSIYLLFSLIDPEQKHQL